MIKKIGLLSILFISFLPNIYAFDATISATKDKINLNDYTKLRIQVELKDEKNVEIKEIKGIENFDILSNTQGSSSSSNIVVVNGQTKTETKSINYIDLTLSPKKAGNYILGPAVLTDGTNSKETNSVNISVDDKKIINDDFPGNRGFEREQNGDYVEVIFSIIALFLLIITFGIIYKFYPNFYNKYFDILKTNKYLKKSENNIEKINEENQESKEIIYPEISDIEFAEKINVILRKKLKNKYYIENIDAKSYNEIYELLPEDIEDKQNLKNIIDTLNKLKYSNLDLEKNEILELVKNI
ncbi:MAG: BatD family protein [Candidatus Gracilibacteria bacterium]|nr:BatD family protein [Candidatus Gracilibacteria bacterium]